MKEECEKKDQDIKCLKKEKRILLVKLCQVKSQVPSLVDDNLTEIELLIKEVQSKIK